MGVSLRAIPEADPDFVLFGAREDIESTFSDLKRKTRGRLNSTRDDFYEFNILAYAMLRLSRSVTAFRRRTTPGSAGQPDQPNTPARGGRRRLTAAPVSGNDATGVSDSGLTPARPAADPKRGPRLHRRARPQPGSRGGPARAAAMAGW